MNLDAKCPPASDSCYSLPTVPRFADSQENQQGRHAHYRLDGASALSARTVGKCDLTRICPPTWGEFDCGETHIPRQANSSLQTTFWSELKM